MFEEPASIPPAQPLRTVGAYELLGEIGSGGMSRVYRARSVATGQVVAVKAINIDNVDDDFERRMRREPDIQSGLAHENIVRLIDYFRTGNEFFLVMEYVDGRSLAQIISQSGPLSFSRARGYFRQLLRAVDQLHRLGIIHRDIKPSNILIDKNDLVRLADFGIAKFTWQQGQTQTQNGLGTPEYMSPEQARGALIDHRTDIFSLGITLFETLTGRKPFTRDDKTPMGYVSVIQEVIGKPLPDPRSYQPSVPSGAITLLNRAAAKNPVERYQSCAEFLEALNQVDEGDLSTPTVALTGMPDPVVPERVPQQPLHTHTEPRRSRLGPGLALLLIVLGIGGFFGYQLWLKGKQSPVPAQTLTNPQAMQIAQQVAVDLKDYGETAPQAYASLFTEKDIEYLGAKNLTRKDIEWKRKKFLAGIIRTDTMDMTVKEARATSDTTIEAELVMQFSRVRSDSAMVRGRSSSLITLRRLDGHWLVSRYRRNWDNSRVDVPKRDTSAVPAVIQPTDTAKPVTPPNGDGEGKVIDLGPGDKKPTPQ